MRIGNLFFSTLREDPADAEMPSHRLLLRAGYIRPLGAGIYSLLPLGMRVNMHVTQVIREEMNAIGGQEMLMPVVHPADLWRETGRYDQIGPEMGRFKDRGGRDMVLAMTHEEVVADLLRKLVSSWRQLPQQVYHFQTKWRDEPRSRGGLIRVREFTMKDAYSFDRDVESAGKTYDGMFAAYTRIFERLGLQFRAVAADTGAIGGDRSHEFQVIADTGEDAIVYCPTSDYAANIELAEAVALIDHRAAPTAALTKVATPGKSTCPDVAELLGLPLSHTVKSLVLATDETNDAGEIVKSTVWLLLVRGDHDLNEVKAGKIQLADGTGLKAGFRFATENPGRRWKADATAAPVSPEVATSIVVGGASGARSRDSASARKRAAKSLKAAVGPWNSSSR